MQLDWQRLEREVERVHTRYQTEVVEAFAFCPWAKEARVTGRVAKVVSFMSTPDARATLALIDRVMRQPATEVGMLIFPLLPLTRLEFSHFVAEVRALDDVRSKRGEAPFALADFHPSPSAISVNSVTPGAALATTPDALVPYLRRTPDPMIQVVRTEVLARVRGSQSHGTSYVDPAQLVSFAIGATHAAILDAAPPPAPLAERLAEHNFRTVQRVGLLQLDGIFRAIQADRTRSYAALGISAPTHAYMEDMYDRTNCNDPEKSRGQTG